MKAGNAYDQIRKQKQYRNAQEPAGGRGGIRTHGELAPTAVFKTAALNHSATLPAAGGARVGLDRDYLRNGPASMGKRGGSVAGCAILRRHEAEVGDDPSGNAARRRPVDRAASRLFAGDMHEAQAAVDRRSRVPGHGACVRASSRPSAPARRFRRASAPAWTSASSSIRGFFRGSAPARA